MWGSPRWVAGSAITAPVATQKQRDAWSGFLRAAIRRYGPGGNYWSGAYRTQHPGKAPLPVNTWQIWNEAKLKSAMTPTDPRHLREASDPLAHGDPTDRPEGEGDVRGPFEPPAEWSHRMDLPPRRRPPTRRPDRIRHHGLECLLALRFGMLDDLDHIRQTMAANGQGPKPLSMTRSAGARTRSTPPAVSMRGLVSEGHTKKPEREERKGPLICVCVCVCDTTCGGGWEGPCSSSISR